MIQRVLVSTTETTYSYVYDGGQLRQVTITLTETADWGTATHTETLSFTYNASGAPQTLTRGNDTYLYVTNLQGDVVAILDNAGISVVEYTYDAWGNLLSVTGSLANTLGADNPLRYRGYVYDTQTRLYYLQSRYYDPEIGRFINADVFISTGKGILGNNMFSYCLNNPTRWKDTNGMDITEVCVDGDEYVGPEEEDDYGGTTSSGYPEISYTNNTTQPGGFSAFSTTNTSYSPNESYTNTYYQTASRSSAVRNAWKLEYNNVANGGNSITRIWTYEQQIELLNTGKVSGFEGHHIKSVSGFPHLRGDPANIQFLTQAEHFAAHNYNWRNITYTRYDG